MNPRGVGIFRCQIEQIWLAGFTGGAKFQQTNLDTLGSVALVLDA